MRKPLFKGTQANATTIAVPLTIVAGRVGFHISWPDATTAATFVLELSSFDSDQAPYGTTLVANADGSAYVATADAQKWPDSGQAISAVVAGAAGARLVNLSNVNQQRARLRITSTAICTWEIRDGVSDK